MSLLAVCPGKLSWELDQSHPKDLRSPGSILRSLVCKTSGLTVVLQSLSEVSTKSSTEYVKLTIPHHEHLSMRGGRVWSGETRCPISLLKNDQRRRPRSDQGPQLGTSSRAFVVRICNVIRELYTLYNLIKSNT